MNRVIKHRALAVLLILFLYSVVLHAQTTSPELAPNLKAALTSYRSQCGSVPLEAKPARRFAHWISSPQESGWLEYPTDAEPWQKWDGAFEGADVFKSSSGLLVQMWAGSDTNDWASSTEYCANEQGSIQSAFTSLSSDGLLTIVEQRADADGKFKVTKAVCSVTDKSSTADCATIEQSVLKAMKLYASVKELPIGVARGSE